MARARRAVTDQLLVAQLDLLRVEAGVRADTLQMLDQMQKELAATLASGNVTDLNKARLASLLSQARAKIAQYYGQISEAMGDALSNVGDVSAAHAAEVLTVHFGGGIEATLPTDAFLRALAGNTLIQGAPSADWWARQATDTAFRVANAVRQGVAQGETMANIVARVTGKRGYPGVMDVSRTNARSLVHTSIMEVAGEARRETYRKNDDVVRGIRQVSTLDSNTTEICIAYDGQEWDLDGEPMGDTELDYDGGVPRHWGCRSVEVPVTVSFKELGLDIPEPGQGERASADGPVPADTTFDEFLTRMGEDFQNETLGEGRAELWRDDKITLPQLLNLSGNPLTLDELREKYDS